MKMTSEHFESGRCPVCKSNYLTYGKISSDDIGIYYPWTCDDCGASGKESYSIEFCSHRDVIKNDRSSAIDVSVDKKTNAMLNGIGNACCKDCSFKRIVSRLGNFTSNVYCKHPNQQHIIDYFEEHRIKKMPGFIGVINSQGVFPIKRTPKWCPLIAKDEHKE